MNALDIILLALIGVSGLMSLRVGLIREVFALGALIVGIFAGVILTRAFAPALPELAGSAVATQVVFFAIAFLVVHVLVLMVGSLIGRVIRTVRLGWADRLLGFVFGCLRGALVGLLLIIGLTFVLPEQHRLLVESRGYEFADRPIEIFSDLLPDKARSELERRHEQIKEWVERAAREARRQQERLPENLGVPL